MCARLKWVWLQPVLFTTDTSLESVGSTNCSETNVQVQMQIEADQQLAALQQQSQPTHQRDWGNGPTGNVQLFHGHQPNGNMNGARPHDGVGMMSQESPIMEDSPPNQARFAGGILKQSKTAVNPALSKHTCCISGSHTTAVWSEDHNQRLCRPSLCVMK